MLHQRLLDALDASSPLLLVEAFPGSGTLTALRQWEERGGHRDGELRMLVDARRLPLEIRPLMTLLWNTLRHRISHDLPDLLEEEGEETMRLAALRALTRIRRPMTLAIHHADQLRAENLSVLLYVLEAGARLVIAGSDLSHLLEEARRRDLYYSRLEDADVRLNRFETGSLLSERGTELGAEALTSLNARPSATPAWSWRVWRACRSRSRTGFSPATGRSPRISSGDPSSGGAPGSPASCAARRISRASRSRRRRCSAPATMPSPTSSACTTWDSGR